MANVAFKRGLQANLPANGSALDGVFYLTTDTGRLYVGQGTNLIELNKSITVVPNATELSAIASFLINNPGERAAAKGEFYYVEDSNILAVYDGSKFVQVNPDTVLTALTSTVNINNNEATISLGATNSDLNHSVTGSSFKLKSGNNNLTIAADQNDNSTIVLTVSNQTSSISASDNATDGVDLTVGAGTVTLQGDSGSFISVERNNNIITISQEVDTLNIGAKSGDTHTAQVSLVTSNNPRDIKDLPQIEYGTENSSKELATYDGTNNKFVLDVYSKAETDSLFATADAMEYKGTFNPNTGTLPASPHNGDTLKVSSAGTVNGEDVKVGDLLIYVEDKTNASNSRWEIIPSGDDQLINVAANASTHTLTIKDGSNPIGSETVQGTANNIVVTSTASGSDLTHTINLAPVTASNTTGTETTLSSTTGTNVITGITVDSYGRVTGAETTSIKVAPVEDISLQDNNGTMELRIDSNPVSFVSSNSLQIGHNNQTSNITIDLVWGSF